MKRFALYMSILMLSTISMAYVSAYTTEDGTTNDMNTFRIKEVRVWNDQWMMSSSKPKQMVKYQGENGMSDKRLKMKSGTGMTNSGMSAEQLVCVRTAVAKRESALLSAWNTASSSQSTAYTTRALALDTAYQITDKTARRTAIENAWKAWMTSSEDARKTRQTSHKSAWDTFKTDTKTCNVSSLETDAGGAQSDMAQ